MTQQQFDQYYNIFLQQHYIVYTRYLRLKSLKKGSLLKGIAFSKSKSRKVSTKKIKNAFLTSYKLTKNDDIKYALKVIDYFIQEPLTTIQMLEFTTNKSLINNIKLNINFDIEEYLISQLGSKYKVLKYIKRYLNSAHPFEEIHIENSFQLYLATLYCDFFPACEDNQVNEYVNNTCEMVVEQFDLDIEPPNYDLGHTKNLDIKIKTIFKGCNLLEINPKNDKKTYIEDDEYIKMMEDEQKFYQNPKEYIKELINQLP